MAKFLQKQMAKVLDHMPFGFPFLKNNMGKMIVEIPDERLGFNPTAHFPQSYYSRTHVRQEMRSIRA